MKRPTFQLLLLAALSTSAAMGQTTPQINCSSGTTARKLVCEFPFSTGGLAAGTSATETATAINTGIATQVSQLPLASASAGTVEVFKGGVYETFNNLGPILTDRAQVVGKGKVFIGFTGSQYVFTDIDGISLGKLPFAYTQIGLSPSGTPISTQYTSATTSLSFKMDQLVGVATVGLSKRIDVTVIVPVERVSLGATSNNSVSYIQNAGSPTAVGPISNPSIYTAGTASGIGDITFNGKSVLQSGERATFSAGFTVRTPTGDDRNLLGSGSWGFNPYVVYSYLAKVSPHAKFGYQWNTKTELNNPTDTLGENRSLPGGMDYDIGADWAAARRLTVAGDLLGNQYLNTPVYLPTTAPVPTSTGIKNLASSTIGNSSYTINNVSAGLKINAFKELVLSGNVLIQLNNNGLRSRPTPLVGISYKF
jgi:hypothetical protein